MRKAPFFLTILLLIFTHGLLAQAPALAWQKCFGSFYLDDGQYIEPTTDGGYIMTGYVFANGGDVTGYHGNVQVGDYWVLKIDNIGTIQWEKCLGGSFFDEANIIHQTPDGGYLVGGESGSNPGDGDVTTPNQGGTDFWLVKLSSTGVIQWQQSYGGDKNEYLYGLQSTSDGGYILAGTTNSMYGQVVGNHGGVNDIWVIKLTSTGVLEWEKCLGGSGDDEAYDVQALPDGSAIITGYTDSQDGDVTGNHGGRDMWVVKLGMGGVILWEKCLGGSGFDVGWGAVATADGGCVAAGYTASNDGNVTGNHGAEDLWVVRLDNTGTLLWQKCYGGSGNDIAYSISASPDGGYLMAGSTTSGDGDITCTSPSGSHQMGWVIKTDAIGTLQWQKVLGGKYYDEEHCVKPTPDGGVIVGGYTGSSDLPGYHPDVVGAIGDFYVAKLAAPSTIAINVPTGILCSASSFTFTAGVTNPPLSFTYQWMRNGVDQGDNSPIYTATSPLNGDQVFCQIVTAGACSTPIPSNTVTLSVSATTAPTVTISGGGPSCQGDPVTFTATVSNAAGSPVYQWQVDGITTSTGSPSFITTGLVNGDNVTCNYSDNSVCLAGGPAISNTIVAQVTPVVTPMISITASTIAVCSGSPVNFTATIQNGGPAPVYQWQVDGQPVGTGSPTYSNSTLADGDIVSCALTSNAACAEPSTGHSNPVLLSVIPTMVSSVSIAYSPLTVCSGQAVTFTATATNAGTQPTYLWQVNSVTTGTDAPTFTTSTLNNGDIVSCGMSDDVGCVTPSVTSVTPVINPTPSVGTAPVILLTKGQSTTLGLPVTGPVASYAWSPATSLSDPAVAAPVAAPLTTTTYTLLVTSPEGCADSGQLTVKVFSALAIPAAFSPNGDGHNDVFYVIGGPIGSVIKDFGVFDRWGQRVFQAHDAAPDDPAFGWDGRIRGQAAPTGVYVYEILMGFADGTKQVYKGTVVLVR